MKYALGNMLNGAGGFGLDPDAKAYINAVVAAGATVSGTQKTAINNFVKGEKAASRWTLLKRMYLPIWGANNPNAIDMVGGTSGSFIGTVTPSSGYVTSDGTSGYFLSDVSPGGAGCTLNGAGAFALITATTTFNLPNTQVLFGSSSSLSGTRFTVTGNGATSLFAGFGPNSGGFTNYLTGTDRRGVVHVQRTSSSQKFLSFRNASGETNTGLLTDNSVALNSTVPMAFMANYFNAVPSSYLANIIRNGAWGMTDGHSIAQSQAFTSALKTLWETCTGLTLP